MERQKEGNEDLLQERPKKKQKTTVSIVQNDNYLIKKALEKAQFIYDISQREGEKIYQNLETVYAILYCMKFIGETLNPKAQYHSPLSTDFQGKYDNIIPCAKANTLRNTLMDEIYDVDVLTPQFLGYLSTTLGHFYELKGQLESVPGGQVNNFSFSVKQFGDPLYQYPRTAGVQSASLLPPLNQFVVMEREARNMRQFLKGISPNEFPSDKLDRDRKRYALLCSIENAGQAYRSLGRDVQAAHGSTLLADKEYKHLYTYLTMLEDQRGGIAHKELMTPLPLKSIVETAEQCSQLNGYCAMQVRVLQQSNTQLFGLSQDLQPQLFQDMTEFMRENHAKLPQIVPNIEEQSEPFYSPISKEVFSYVDTLLDEPGTELKDHLDDMDEFQMGRSIVSSTRKADIDITKEWVGYMKIDHEFMHFSKMPSQFPGRESLPSFLCNTQDIFKAIFLNKLRGGVTERLKAKMAAITHSSHEQLQSFRTEFERMQESKGSTLADMTAEEWIQKKEELAKLKKGAMEACEAYMNTKLQLQERVKKLSVLIEDNQLLDIETEATESLTEKRKSCDELSVEDLCNTLSEQRLAELKTRTCTLETEISAFGMEINANEKRLEILTGRCNNLSTYSNAVLVDMSLEEFTSQRQAVDRSRGMIVEDLQTYRSKVAEFKERANKLKVSMGEEASAEKIEKLLGHLEGVDSTIMQGEGTLQALDMDALFNDLQEKRKLELECRMKILEKDYSVLVEIVDLAVQQQEMVNQEFQGLSSGNPAVLGELWEKKKSQFMISKEETIAFCKDCGTQATRLEERVSKLQSSGEEGLVVETKDLSEKLAQSKKQLETSRQAMASLNPESLVKPKELDDKSSQALVTHHK